MNSFELAPPHPIARDRSRSNVGRADLLRALHLGDAFGKLDWFPLPDIAQGNVGFELCNETQEETKPPIVDVGDQPDMSQMSVTTVRAPLREPAMWAVTSDGTEPIEGSDQKSTEADRAPEEIALAALALPQSRPTEDQALAAIEHQSALPLMRPSALRAGLRAAFAAQAAERWRGRSAVDWRALTVRLARQQPLLPLPLKRAPVWPANATLLLDWHAQSMTPFVQDMERLERQLRRWIGHRALRVGLLQEDPTEPATPKLEHGGGRRGPSFMPNVREATVLPAAPGDCVLLVSDMAAGRPYRAQRGPGPDSARQIVFERLLVRMARVGARPLVLAPVSAKVMTRLPGPAWFLGWHDGGTNSVSRHGHTHSTPACPQSSQAWSDGHPVRTLLTLLSLGHRTSDSLLRALRRLVPGAESNAAVEWQVWNHPDVEVAGRHLWLRKSARAKHEAAVARLPTCLVMAAYQVRRRLIAGLDALDDAFVVLTAHALAQQAREELAADYQKAHDYVVGFIGRCQATDAASRTQLSVQAVSFIEMLPRQVVDQNLGMIRSLATLAYDASLRQHEVVCVRGDIGAITLSSKDSASTGRQWLLNQYGTSLCLVPAGVRLMGVGLSRSLGPADLQDVLTVQIGEAPRRQLLLPMHAEGLTLAKLDPSLPPIRIGLGRQRVTIEPILRPSWAREWGRDERGLYALTPFLAGHHARFDVRTDQPVNPQQPWFTEDQTWVEAYAIKPAGENDFEQKISFGIDVELGLYADLTANRVVQRFRWIEPGSFLMGSPEGELDQFANEGPQHEVTLTNGYWLADTACTQALWESVMGENPSHFNGDPQRPVECVSWNDVEVFLRKLEALVPGCEAGLPTEAQWEYACRAGTQAPFSFGEQITPEQVNYDGNVPYAGGAKGLYREQTVAVKSLPANDWGLYEMHGNVWEWCADGMRTYDGKAQRDPVGPLDGGSEGLRVVRGGSWYSSARYARSAYRHGRLPGFAYQILGFRLCLRSQEQGPGRAILQVLSGRDGPTTSAGTADVAPTGRRHPGTASSSDSIGSRIRRKLGLPTKGSAPSPPKNRKR